MPVNTLTSWSSESLSLILKSPVIARFGRCIISSERKTENSYVSTEFGGLFVDGGGCFLLPHYRHIYHNKDVKDCCK